MVNAIEAIKETLRAYVSQLAAFTDERKRASDALMLMDEFNEAKALRLRYLLGWKWERVCVEMGYSWDGMMSMRRRALAHYYEVMPHAERDPVHRAT